MCVCDVVVVIAVLVVGYLISYIYKYNVYVRQAGRLQGISDLKSGDASSPVSRTHKRPRATYH